MTPYTSKEARYFILGLSLSAGICVDILFRANQMQVLGEHVPTYAVVIISVLLLVCRLVTKVQFIY